MQEKILELNSLVKEFDKKKAVDNISFSLNRGEILGLLGPNGAGKTTTIRMIMNIIVPDSGEIKILGKNFNENLKNKIGYLPEERGLYRKLKVMDTIEFFGELKGMKTNDIKNKAEVLLAKFNLLDYKDKKVEELSKGMAQKLQIIITIIHSPELLILDEPFSGLDPVNIEMVKDIILEKKKEGVSIIFSTHLMDFAEKLVDNVVMINKGKKVLDGELTEIKSQFGKRFVKINYEGDSAFLSSLPYIQSFKDYGNEIEIELKNIEDKDKLLKDISSKFSINSFILTEPSLNNIFIRKVKEGESK